MLPGGECPVHRSITVLERPAGPMADCRRDPREKTPSRTCIPSLPGIRLLRHDMGQFQYLVPHSLGARESRQGKTLQGRWL